LFSMKLHGNYLLLLACLYFFFPSNCLWAEEKIPSAPLPDRASFSAARLGGCLEDDRLVECSGMEPSLATGDLFWAINDGGHGPLVYALRRDGRGVGRVLVMGAQNRDWEGLDTFLWQGRPMILIADCGDNHEQHDTHTLYVIEEPRLFGERYGKSTAVKVAWEITFSYLDRPHDAEGVAVDATNGQVLVLTKRDNPPLLFELPLMAPATNHPVVAHQVTAVDRIPPPSKEDLRLKYGNYRSQPTALDLSADCLRAVVLTYKHAYLFHRSRSDQWAAAFRRHPLVIPLPLPQDRSNLRQREAICFEPESGALLVTSEGKGAGIYQLDPR
jgi:hypothetical protein